MSVLIKGMELPASCSECDLESIGRCCALGGATLPAGFRGELTRHYDCPLVEVPPHGDLIDREALGVMSWCQNEVEDSFTAGVLFVLDHADELPAIIEEDWGEEDGT